MADDESISSNQWHHVAAVKEGANLFLYVDGIIVGSYNNNSLLNGIDNVGRVSIARRPNSSSFNGNIRVDETRLWNEARSQNQIQDFMNSELSGSETNLIAYYNFNEGSGSNLTDLTGNGLNGNIQNADWLDSEALIYPIVSDDICDSDDNNEYACIDNDGDFVMIVHQFI